MKRLALTITAAVLAFGAFFALPAAAGGLLIRSNVPACDPSLSVEGFSVIGNGPVYYVAESKADLVCVDAVVVPADVDVYELDRVLDYLASIGITGLTPVLPMRLNEFNEWVFTRPNDHW